MLTLSFYLGRPWLGPKLYALVAEATGREPAMYLDAPGQTLILCVPKDPGVVLPANVDQFTGATLRQPAARSTCRPTTGPSST